MHAEVVHDRFRYPCPKAEEEECTRKSRSKYTAKLYLERKHIKEDTKEGRRELMPPARTTCGVRSLTNQKDPQPSFQKATQTPTLETNILKSRRNCDLVEDIIQDCSREWGGESDTWVGQAPRASLEQRNQELSGSKS